MTITTTKRTHNFSAGPAALPLEVLEKAQRELVDFKSAGMSVMEMSHRSKEFSGVIESAEARARRLLNISDDYAVLFLQGGASLQFSMIPMNLCQAGKPVDVVNTGSWTKKAIKELNKIGEANIIASSEDKNFSYIPSLSDLNFNADASYSYITSNNTIAGTQWKEFPKTPTPLVADMSSDIVSRRINVNDFGIIFAGAQKNIGPSGVTLVIIRKDLLERADESLPTMLQYRTHVDNNSLYNTPPTFGIYMIDLVFEWLEAKGGLEAIEAINVRKAKRLYDAFDGDFYICPVAEGSRSDMNVVFRIQNNEELEAQFVKEATAAGLSGLKGHRSVGGLRASIYNACPEESVDALIAFMKDFESRNR
jgi:phosphoserine aminotransferase